ncbi:MAG: arylamine N-acetyltransferase [Gemmatimonadales bacterium]
MIHAGLGRYLARLGLDRAPPPTTDTLIRLHRAHLERIAYENLDIHLGVGLPLGEEAAVAKLGDGRGGWCYEMNGCFGWVLRELGFTAHYAAGTVRRRVAEPVPEGNHLVIVVELERRYLADVGFGNGLLEPVPLEEGCYRQDGFEVRLAREADRWIVLFGHEGSDHRFDLTTTPRPLAWFASECRRLQTDPASPFVRRTVCHRFDGEGFVTLRGAVLTRTTPRGATSRVLADADDYVETLRGGFGLDLPEVRRLWPVVMERHLAWTAATREVG